MLDVLKLIFICLGCFSSCVWLTADHRPAMQWVDNDTTTICQQQAEEIKSSGQIEELVHLIIDMRSFLIAQGCYFPPIDRFLDDCRSLARQYGLHISDAEFDQLKAEFQHYDTDVPYKEIKHKHKHHKKHKEVKVSSRTAMGFLKFVGGALLCIVPIAPIQAAGATLAVVGISEMIDEARTQSDNRDIQERLDANRRVDRDMENH